MEYLRPQPRPRNRRDDLGSAPGDQRVHDSVEHTARLVISKRLGRQRLPVQRSVCKQDVATERVDQRGQPLGARLDHFTRQHIAVDNDSAALRERRGQQRLPGANAAGQPDAQHYVNAISCKIKRCRRVFPQGRQLGVAGQ